MEDKKSMGANEDLGPVLEKCLGSVDYLTVLGNLELDLEGSQDIGAQ